MSCQIGVRYQQKSYHQLKGHALTHYVNKQDPRKEAKLSAKIIFTFSVTFFSKNDINAKIIIDLENSLIIFTHLSISLSSVF